MVEKGRGAGAGVWLSVGGDCGDVVDVADPVVPMLPEAPEAGVMGPLAEEPGLVTVRFGI